ncbi:TLD domain-containing protein 2, putative [Babesia ovis]|uniref:Oxidation resistance protein 1 n=1 Tax=Babesia ovis TaxID=5869 RepID=A0A9W5TC19_BABOV|nr:TLD domain-containing protein 2, putative [Babesia ovis]
MDPSDHQLPLTRPGTFRELVAVSRTPQSVAASTEDTGHHADQIIFGEVCHYCIKGTPILGRLTLTTESLTFEPDARDATVKERGCSYYQVHIDLTSIAECGLIGVSSDDLSSYDGGNMHCNGLLQILLKTRSRDSSMESSAETIASSKFEDNAAGGHQEKERKSLSYVLQGISKLSYVANMAGFSMAPKLPPEKPVQQAFPTKVFVVFAFFKKEIAHKCTMALMDALDAARFREMRHPTRHRISSVPFASNALLEMLTETNRHDGNAPPQLQRGRSHESGSRKQASQKPVSPRRQSEDITRCETELRQRVEKQSRILSADMVSQLVDSLPPALSIRDWELTFNTSHDGVSFHTLYKKLEGHGDCLLVIKDDNGGVFGAFTGHIGLSYKYYGTAHTFVFKFVNGRLKVYHSKGNNKCFVYSNEQAIVIGGGDNSALSIHEAFQSGTTASCETFNNEPLSQSFVFNIDEMEMLKSKIYIDDVASTSADSELPSVDATMSFERTDCCDVPPELVDLKIHIAARFKLFYRRTGSIARLACKSDLVHKAVMKKILELNLRPHETRALEVCFMIVDVVRQRLEKTNCPRSPQDTVDGGTNQLTDICMETCAVIATEELKYSDIREPIQDILTMCSIWGIECAVGSNLSKLCYYILCKLGNYRLNLYLQRYIKTFFDSKHCLDTEIYYRLLLLRIGLKNGLFQNKERLLCQYCLTIARGQCSIYVADAVTSLLAEVWQYAQASFDTLPCGTRYRLVAKLLVKGVDHRNVVPLLLTTAISGTYEQRKIALGALLAQSTEDISSSWGDNLVSSAKGSDNGITIGTTTYTLEHIENDLGILVVGAAMIQDINSAEKYLKQLYMEMLKLVRNPKTSTSSRSTDTNMGNHSVTNADIGATSGNLDTSTCLGTSVDSHSTITTKTGPAHSATSDWIHNGFIQGDVDTIRDKYFVLRDLLQAVDATLQRIGHLQNNENNNNSVSGHTTSTITGDLGTNGGIHAGITVYNHVLMISIYLGAMCPELGPYVIGIVNSTMPIGRMDLRVVIQWIDILKKCDSAVLDSLGQMVYKLVNQLLQHGINQAKVEDNLLDPEAMLIDKVVHLVKTMLTSLGTEVVRYSFGNDIAKTLMYTAAWLARCRNSHQINRIGTLMASCMHKMLLYFLQPAGYVTDCSGTEHMDLRDVVQYRGDVPVYIAVAFEILAKTGVLPKEELVSTLMELTWNADVAKSVFYGLEALVYNTRNKRLWTLVCTSVLRSPVHTDWDIDTLDALHQLLYSLRVVYKRKYSTRWKTYCIQGYTPGSGWKARSNRRLGYRPVRVYNQNGDPVTQRIHDLMKYILQSARMMPVATREPITLLSQSLEVVEGIKDTGFHDCPGE